MYLNPIANASFAHLKLISRQANSAKARGAFENSLRGLRQEAAAKPHVKADLRTPAPQSPPTAESIGNGKLFSIWDKDATVEKALETLDLNLSKIGDFSLSSDIDVQEAIEHLASQYSVYKNHIKKNGTAEQLKQLDAIVEKQTNKYARQFSEVVGGFFEENGLSGEKEAMYQAVKERVAVLSSSYDGFISNHGDAYDKLVEKAQKGKTCLAFTLRAEYVKDGDGEIFDTNKSWAYTREALTGAAELVKFAKIISKSGKAQAVSEEELGVELGKLALNALSFLEKGNATGKHKEAFLKSVDLRIEDLIAESDKALDTQRSSGKKREEYPPLDRDSIFS